MKRRAPTITASSSKKESKVSDICIAFISPLAMINTFDDLFKDLETIRKISIVPNMLEVICQTTGMGFAAVARVTKDRWLACRVRDEVEFGLEEGGELKIETTICNEVREFRKPVVFDNAAEDPSYRNHHTPKLYGLQSYISVPILLKDGSFFGTLCAIDAKPAKVNNPKVVDTFTMFAELLAFHIDTISELDRSQKLNDELALQNKVLNDVNTDLDNFVYTASHDLKSPVANIQALLNILSDTIKKDPVDRERVNKIMGMMNTSMKKFSSTVNELTTFVEAYDPSSATVLEEVNVHDVVENVKQDLSSMITETGAKIDVVVDVNPYIIFSKKNLKSILYNFISNALKYRSAERAPEILIKFTKEDDKTVISVEDNGLGIPADKKDEVFSMFKRLHNHVEGTGLGLYIVKRMIDSVKGTVLVDSTLNKGTKFTVAF